MAGGFLKGFGITLIVLGALLVVGGLAAAAFGGYVVNEEDNRGLFADRDKGEAAAEGAVLALGAAGVGALVLILGVLLTVAGASRARREMLRMLSGAGGAGAAAAPTPRSTAAPAPRRASATPGESSRRTFAVLAVAALLLVGVVAAIEMDLPEAIGRAAYGGAGGDAPPQPQVVSFQGRVQGGRAPVLGAFDTGAGSTSHVMTPEHASGVLVGTLDWPESGPAGAARLVLVLEREANGVWEEMARGEGGPDLVVEAPSAAFAGKIRARVLVSGEAGAVNQAYGLTLTLHP